MNLQDLRQRLNIFMPMSMRCRLTGHDWETLHAIEGKLDAKRCRRCFNPHAPGSGGYQLISTPCVEAELWMKAFAKREGVSLEDLMVHTDLYCTDDEYRHECGARFHYSSEFWLHYKILAGVKAWV